MGKQPLRLIRMMRILLLIVRVDGEKIPGIDQQVNEKFLLTVRVEGEKPLGLITMMRIFLLTV